MNPWPKQLRHCRDHKSDNEGHLHHKWRNKRCATRHMLGLAPLPCSGFASPPEQGVGQPSCHEPQARCVKCPLGADLLDSRSSSPNAVLALLSQSSAAKRYGRAESSLAGGSTMPRAQVSCATATIAHFPKSARRPAPTSLAPSTHHRPPRFGSANPSGTKIGAPGSKAPDGEQTPKSLERASVECVRESQSSSLEVGDVVALAPMMAMG